MRLPTPDEIETFWRDGVVCLRGVLDPELLAAMAAPVDALIAGTELADLSAMGDALAAAGETVTRDDAPRRGRFVSGVDHWRNHEAFRAFACDSPLPAVVAAILRSDAVFLWEDSVLVKEPGTVEHTHWHQDLPYFHVTGDQLATTWCPLDPATAQTGAMRFVRGSHRTHPTYQPNLFVTPMVIPGTEGTPAPDIDALAALGEVELVAFDLEPGDITVHHAATLHAAGPNRSADTSRRAISVRYCGGDARYQLRPGAPQKPHHASVHDGDPLGGPDCPQVWPA